MLETKLVFEILRRNCGRCHDCDTVLIIKDGEEWCESCKAIRRYRSHGWIFGDGVSGDAQCPERFFYRKEDDYED